MAVAAPAQGQKKRNGNRQNRGQLTPVARTRNMNGRNPDKARRVSFENSEVLDWTNSCGGDEIKTSKCDMSSDECEELKINVSIT